MSQGLEDPSKRKLLEKAGAAVLLALGVNGKHAKAATSDTSTEKGKALSAIAREKLVNDIKFDNATLQLEISALKQFNDKDFIDLSRGGRPDGADRQMNKFRKAMKWADSAFSASTVSGAITGSRHRE